MGDTSENMTTILKCGESTDQTTVSSSVEKFMCSLCGYKFNQQRSLTNHFKLCKQAEDPADKLVADILTIKREIKTEDEMHSMELVDEHTTTEPTSDIKLEEIEFTETTVSGIACPQSGQPPESLKTETSEELFTLTKDDYTTAQPTQLEEYVYTPQKPYYICTTCDYTCAKRSVLTVHMRKHTTEKPYKCTRCDYTCTHRPSLKVHMRTHTGEKPFKCTICDYASTRSSDLTLHMRKHTGEKPFKCAMCEYSSALNTTLKEHIRKHTGEKPYKCAMCNYVTSRPSTLTLHMRRHTGEKPYKCTICEYSCAQNAHLKQHMRKHTGEKPYKCTICDYSSAHHVSLKFHMTKH